MASPAPANVMIGRQTGVLPVLVLLAISAAVVVFAVYRGWTRRAADFPSYYTAAVLLKKRERLSRFYDMPYFQRQMDLAGIDNQLGGYIPQTPVTMLPFVPLAGFPVQTAKRVWLLASVLFLGATIWLLFAIRGLGLPAILALLILGSGSLYTNFLLGQYYILLLFLMTAGVFCLEHKRAAAGGFLFGLVCGLKLVTAPFLLYFAAKRQWKALAGMSAGALLLVITAIALFGWTGVTFYATHIFPRSIAGETLDPFNPAIGTFTTLLRKSFISEPELNPSPLLNSPWLFFFLRALFSLTILWTSLLAFSQARAESVSVAGLLISVLLLSPNTASYTFLLLLLPVAILLPQTSRRGAVFLMGFYFLLAIPMRPSWNWLFPKVWLLAALFIAAVLFYGAQIERRTLGIGLGAAALTSLLLAGINVRDYRNGANQRWDPVAVEPGAIYSSSPVSFPNGLLYEAIKDNHYSLQWLHDKRLETLSFAGNAFRPVSLYGTELARFDLVSGTASEDVLFDPATGTVRPDSQPDRPGKDEPTLSPDGKWIAFSQSSGGSAQVYICAPDGQRVIPVTRGNCNSSAPGWEWDSSALLFASDCGRGVGLPALYRAPLSRVLAQANAR